MVLRKIFSAVFSRAAVSVSAVLFVSVLGQDVARADVYQGYWIRGPIAETYIRLGGFAQWGDAIGDEVVRSRGGLSQDFQADASIYWQSDVAGGVAHLRRPEVIGD